MIDKALKDNSSPNIVIWSWMRTVLNLSGSELLIFAYLYSQTFDNGHRCYSTLANMSDWFGLNRNTVARNIDKMVVSGIVSKETLQDLRKPLIKHNRYQVNMTHITNLCEKSDFNSYTNFIASYKQILIQKFPDDSKKIETYFDRFLSWHENKHAIVQVDMLTLSQLLCRLASPGSVPESENFLTNIANLINPSEVSSVVNEINPIQNNIVDPCNIPTNNTKSNKNPITPENYPSLFPPVKPVSTKSKKVLFEEHLDTKRKMNAEFCALYGNDALLDMLNKFLETKHGESFYPGQWKTQLEDLKTLGETPDRMFESVRNSYKSNYRFLIYEDKNATLFKDKLAVIDTFISTNGENNVELRQLLIDYIKDVTKGQQASSNQLKRLLEELKRICVTVPQMIESVGESYTHSWAALAYKDRHSSNNNNSDYLSMSTLSKEECTQQKVQLIENFIDKNYYHLHNEVKEMLLKYINSVPSGINMSPEMFQANLELLRLYCLSEDRLKESLLTATVKNLDVLCKEDFAESRQIASKHMSRDSLAESYARTRHQHVLTYQSKHPNDPRLKNLPPLQATKQVPQYL